MAKGSHKDKIKKIEEDANDRPKPSGLQHIVLTPSTLKTRGTPEWMRSAQANAMIEETERYQESARKDKSRELCMGIVPLEENDGFPLRMAKILDTDGIVHAEGKPCSNNSLKTSPYCSSCKKAINRKQADF